MAMPQKPPIATRTLTEAFPRMAGNPQLTGRDLKTLQGILDRTREFCDQHVRPRALELDQRAWDDIEDFPWDLAREGGKRGLFSVSLPPQAGGEARFMVTTLATVMEEMSAACPGVAVIFGAHGLGVGPLAFGGPAQWDGVMSKIVQGEQSGDPVIMSFAITEPSAGTDMENPDLVDAAHLGCHAKPVKGGFLLNGTKCFISNGPQARYVTVYMPVDPARPRATMTCFLVDSRSPGFKVGHIEHKMGQRASRASELIFEDMFVSEDDVIGSVGDGVTNMMGVLIGSRPCVGAIGTGIARGAYERLLEWLLNDPEGRLLLERQQVRMALAQMEEEIHLSRQAYMDAATEFDNVSIGKLMKDPGVRLLGKIPKRVRTSPLVQRQMQSGMSRKAVMFLLRRRVGNRGLTRALAMSSMAKARGADTGMKVAGMALEIAGLSSGPLRAELEKLVRDAKLTQIFEGTNQLNRLEVAEGLSLGGEIGLLPIGAGKLPPAVDRPTKVSVNGASANGVAAPAKAVAR
jgi:alkylation response protein AidB-like acyl-CoA dehydrogenase